MNIKLLNSDNNMEVVQLPHMEYEDNPQVKVLLESSEMPQLKSRMIMDS